MRTYRVEVICHVEDDKEAMLTFDVKHKTLLQAVTHAATTLKNMFQNNTFEIVTVTEMDDEPDNHT